MSVTARREYNVASPVCVCVCVCVYISVPIHTVRNLPARDPEVTLR